MTHMRAGISAILVVAGVSAAVTQLLGAPQPGGDTITDPVAYAVYASVLPIVWPDSNGTLLLIRETEGPNGIEPCLSAVSAEPEWSSVATNFTYENTTVRTLEPGLPVGFAYRLVPRAEIAADDARLVLKYPGTWHTRPESIEYAAVSAVGFDVTKTKALVYVRLRSKGNLYARELRDGSWVLATLKNGCSGWIV